MVNTAFGVFAVGWFLVVALHVVPALIDAREACDPDARHSDAAGVAEVVNVGRHPPAEGQLLQEVGRFVVAADEDCENRRRLLTRVVLVESAHFSVLLRHGHAIQIVLVAHGLEVAAAQQQVHLDVFLLLEVRQSFVDALQLTVSAPFYCHFHFRTLEIFYTHLELPACLSNTA